MTPPVSVVTGVSSGLGLEIALELCGYGYTVVGVSRTSPDRAIWHDLARDGIARHVAGDVGDDAVARRAFDTAQSLGEPTLLVNCAGVGVFGPVGSYSRDDVDTVLHGNLIGIILFSEGAVRQFRTSGGTIANVIAMEGREGREREAVYSAANWGARGYTEALRNELRGSAIRVVSIYPDSMHTAFWSKAKGSVVEPEGLMEPEMVAKVIVHNLAHQDGMYISDMVIAQGRF